MCVILLLKMLDWVFSSERTKYLKEIYVLPEECLISKILRMGMGLIKSLVSSKNIVTALLKSMMHLVFVTELNLLPFHHQLIGNICE